MALTNFIGAVWANSILMGLNRSLVWAQEGVVNRSYEGLIKNAGDTVNINNVGDITVFDYTKNTAMPDPQVLDATQIKLVINQAKGFNFMVDDIDRIQADATLLAKATTKAVNALKAATETYVASVAVAGTAAGNVIGTTGAKINVSAAGAAFDQLVALGVKLDKADVSEDGRWVIADPDFVALLSKDPRWATVGEAGVLRNGFSGSAAGFTVYKSNNAPASQVVAGTGDAIAYAEQIPAEQVEAYRPEKYFADAVKGLHLYGAKVVNDKGLAVLNWGLS
ncbi:hypothetical protein OHA74_20760 [Streptomyces phaeochromogenes]|uniref:phage major capsid protein n=1 Tax=Streptomyces phaeochromogenes TaxID=1923 RepID=UPI002E284C92|nr:hypothetical protein [Streptomyces phaeochromogenes]